MAEYAHEGFIRGTVDAMAQAEVDSKVFYQEFLRKNKPLVVLDGATAWPALVKWSEEDYISS